MEYVVCFVAGAAAAASALLIWYFAYIGRLRKERQAIKVRDDQIAADRANLVQHSNALESWRQQTVESFATQAAELEGRKRHLADSEAAFETRKVRYEELVRENDCLKQDLFNLSVRLKKTERDHAAIIRRQEDIAERTSALGGRYLEENVRWIGAKLTSKNFSSCKDRLLRVIAACRDIGLDVPAERERSLVEELKEAFEEAVRQEFAREEQARIKAQIREEERLAREFERQKQEAEKKKREAERSQAAIEAAVEKALKDGKDERSAEVMYLKAQLEEAREAIEKAEAERERALSRAQMTRSGHVYVLSNIGSFGEGVFKVGMTRREQPQDRVAELGDASVPFPFDVHMMISCDDAPTLENELHRELHGARVNKVNFRKEYFFNVDLELIRRIAEAHDGKVLEFRIHPEAGEYWEGKNMRDEDYEFVERTMQDAMAEQGTTPGED